MSCLKAKTGDIKPKTFLTKEEKLVFLYRLFLRERAKHKSAIFVPSDTFYPEGKVDDQHLNDMGKELLAWLGVKHHNLSIRFSTGEASSPEYIHDKHKPAIIIPYTAYDNPYYCAALLTHSVMHYYVTSRHHLALDEDQNEEFTDLACIAAGLGIVLMNGFIPRHGGLTRLFRHAHIPVPGMDMDELASETKHFLAHSPVNRNTWLATALPSTRRLLGEHQSSLPASPYVQREMQSLRRSRRVSALIIFGAVLLVGANLLFIAISPKNMPPEQQARKERIEALRISYDICMDSVAKKRRSLNQDDIFMLRVIARDENTCTSIMNKHNYEVDQYNKYWRH